MTGKWLGTCLSEGHGPYLAQAESDRSGPSSMIGDIRVHVLNKFAREHVFR